jgi:hypothetical protein
MHIYFPISMGMGFLSILLLPQEQAKHKYAHNQRKHIALFLLKNPLKKQHFTAARHD